MSDTQDTLLAGDIGGTKTTLALFSPRQGPRQPLAERTFPSVNYDSLEAIIKEFLAEAKVKPHWATFGVAGPVMEGQATITNLPWVMTENQLARQFSLAQVHLINDLVAIAQAVLLLQPDDLHTLNQGQPVSGGTIAVIAPGTGLGEAYLTWDGHAYQPRASEGGHTDFAPNNELEIGMLRYLLEQLEGHVSYERVCSGIGIANIYRYLKESDQAPEPDWLAEKLATVKDPVPTIINTALDESIPCQICDTTLKLFVSILGTEAGNMALNVLATGGVYLGGGIPPRILKALERDAFMEEFCRKGRMSSLLHKIPIHIILNPKVALLGAASYGLAHRR